MSQPYEELEAQPFEILQIQTREYRRFSTRGTQWKVGLNPSPETPLPETPLRDPITHLIDSVKNLFDHVLENVGDADMSGSLFITR